MNTTLAQTAPTTPAAAPLARDTKIAVIFTALGFLFPPCFFVGWYCAMQATNAIEQSDGKLGGLTLTRVTLIVSSVIVGFIAWAFTIALFGAIGYGFLTLITR